MVFNVKKLLNDGVEVMIGQRILKNDPSGLSSRYDLSRRCLVFASECLNTKVYQELI
jgi:hypothetical protein